MHKKIELVLDFDGVLFNTAEEAYSVCIRTPVFNRKRFNHKAYLKFLRLRPLVGPAWNYYEIMQIILKKKSPSSLLFRKTLRSVHFEKKFFKTRYKFKRNLYKRWIKLNTPYAFFFKLSAILSKYPNCEVSILSTKDKKTISDLLACYPKSAKYFDNIYDKTTFDKYGSKCKFLMEKQSKEKKKILFIDDSTQHIEKCRNIRNIIPIQASWGYVSPKDLTIYAHNMDDTLQIIIDFIKETS